MWPSPRGGLRLRGEVVPLSMIIDAGKKHCECRRAAVNHHLDCHADQCSDVRHFCHTDLVPSEVFDDGTLMIMEARPGDGIAHLEAGSAVGEIPGGRLNELLHDFYSQFRCQR